MVLISRDKRISGDLSVETLEPIHLAMLDGRRPSLQPMERADDIRKWTEKIADAGAIIATIFAYDGK
jgi:hypothetical protein